MPNNQEPEEHDTVGHYFTGLSGVYLCTRFERGNGFWMRLVEQTKDPLIDLPLGYETCVSVRAVGRTYHKVRRGPLAERYEANHQTPCECYVCQPES